MAALPQPRLTDEQYLTIERTNKRAEDDPERAEEDAREPAERGANYGAWRGPEPFRAERGGGEVDRVGERGEHEEQREPAPADVREVLCPRRSNQAREQERRAGQGG